MNNKSTKTILIFYLIDTSGSMLNNQKIDYLNKAMHKATELLKAHAKKDSRNIYLVRTCCFGGYAAHFVEKKLIPIEKYEFKDITDIKKGDKTPLSSAYNLLNLSLSNYAGRDDVEPFIILVTDGASTDNYRSNLRKFLESEWANKSHRMAIAIGEKAIIENINEFVGDMDKIKRVNNNQELAESIVAASLVPVKNNEEIAPVEESEPEVVEEPTPVKEETKKPAPQKPAVNFIFSELNSEDAPATLTAKKGEEDDDDNSIPVNPKKEEQSGNSLTAHDDDEI